MLFEANGIGLLCAKMGRGLIDSECGKSESVSNIVVYELRNPLFEVLCFADNPLCGEFHRLARRHSSNAIQIGSFAWKEDYCCSDKQIRGWDGRGGEIQPHLPPLWQFLHLNT